MTVYFVTARALNRVKIGWSDDPQRRLVKMSADSPTPLVLERVCDGGQEVEADLHARFAGARIAGEWFEISPEIEAFMAMQAVPELRATKGSVGRPLKFGVGAIGQLREELGLTLEGFASKVGLKSKGQLHQIENGARCSVKVAIAIEALSVADGAPRIDAADLSEDVKLSRHGCAFTDLGVQDHD